MEERGKKMFRILDTSGSADGRQKKKKQKKKSGARASRHGGRAVSVSGTLFIRKDAVSRFEQLVFLLARGEKSVER